MNTSTGCREVYDQREIHPARGRHCEAAVRIGLGRLYFRYGFVHAAIARPLSYDIGASVWQSTRTFESFATLSTTVLGNGVLEAPLRQVVVSDAVPFSHEI